MEEYGVQHFIVVAVVLLVLILGVLALSRGMPFAKKIVSSSWPVLMALSLVFVLMILKISSNNN